MTRLTERDLKNFLKRGQSAQAAIDVLTEKQWQEQVKGYAEITGWDVYHTFDSRRSEEGFPDLVMARWRSPDPSSTLRMVVAELKVEGEKPTLAQQRWLDYFKEIGAEVYVWRPSDWDEVQKILR